MRPSGGIGGVTRPGRGDDVDLEALQDAFLRSAERPSAKVTRAKVSRHFFKFTGISVFAVMGRRWH